MSDAHKKKPLNLVNIWRIIKLKQFLHLLKKEITLFVGQFGHLSCFKIVFITLVKADMVLVRLLQPHVEQTAAATEKKSTVFFMGAYYRSNSLAIERLKTIKEL